MGDILPGVGRAIMRLADQGNDLIKLVKSISELTKEMKRLNDNLEKEQAARGVNHGSS